MHLRSVIIINTHIFHILQYTANSFTKDLSVIVFVEKGESLGEYFFLFLCEAPLGEALQQQWISFPFLYFRAKPPDLTHDSGKDEPAEQQQPSPRTHYTHTLDNK